MSDMTPGQIRTQALALFLEIYAVSETGGPLHVEIDDGNLEDHRFEGDGPDVDWWQDETITLGQQMRIRQAAAALAQILGSWTETEREEFVSYAHRVHSKVAYHWEKFTPTPSQLGYAHGQALRAAADALPANPSVSAWLRNRAEKTEKGQLS